MGSGGGLLRYPVEKTPARLRSVAVGALWEEREGDLGGFCSAGGEFTGGALFCLRLEHVDVGDGAGLADLFKEVAVAVLFEDDDAGSGGGHTPVGADHGGCGPVVVADGEKVLAVHGEDVDAAREVRGLVIWACSVWDRDAMETRVARAMVRMLDVRMPDFMAVPPGEGVLMTAFTGERAAEWEKGQTI